MSRLIWSSLLLLWSAASFAQPTSAAPDRCGEVVAIEMPAQSPSRTSTRTSTRASTRITMRYTLAFPHNAVAQAPRAVLVLLVGGGGHLDLDDKGCPRALAGNSLVRSLPHWHGAGFATALVDARSDHGGEDGLAGFRITDQHAADLGKVIAAVRARFDVPVWVVGTSRGSISAANAASRLSGPAAPDGVVLTSALMAGAQARKSWVAHSVFDIPLERIRVPILVVGHASDTCIRSPANLMGQITARTNGAREQVVTVTGGPGAVGASSTDACAGRTPHGFLQQEAEVVTGIARFIAGAAY